MSNPRHSPSVVAEAFGVSEVLFLGAGAYGDTWKIGDNAVKVICEDGYPADRLAREIRGLSRVRNQHVVRLHKSEEIILDGASRPALTFEYIDGGDLQEKLDASTLPNGEQATKLLIGLLVGVGALHAADGTIHRDIKPPNVALRSGRWEDPVILDLGLAKSVKETTVTVYPGLIGTTAYMAPEQIQGKRARKAADLFAVGVTVRALINGRHPFYEGGAAYTFDEAIARIKDGPTSLPVDISKETSAVLDRLVSYHEYERGSASSNLKKLGVK